MKMKVDPQVGWQTRSKRISNSYTKWVKSKIKIDLKLSSIKIDVGQKEKLVQNSSDKVNNKKNRSKTYQAYKVSQKENWYKTHWHIKKWVKKKNLLKNHLAYSESKIKKSTPKLTRHTKWVIKKLGPNFTGRQGEVSLKENLSKTLPAYKVGQK